ncbi:MAG TPA: hypothetical protein VFT65_05260 [Candidatus Angelobacter sp.]|nr:hypothetical protein [Candidatus Angelobacter sp.]
MMLWHKAWRETRTRFLVSAVALVAFSAAIVLAQVPIREHAAALPGFRSGPSYSLHIYNFVYSGLLKTAFIWMIFFLGLGGLPREQAQGTAGFTLALPVSRLRLVSVRMAVGLAELTALALAPALIIPALSLAIHQYYPLSEALHFSVLWIICGTTIYAMTFLFSAMLGGEYTALVVSIVVFFVLDLIVSLAPLQPYRLKLLHIISEFGTMRWDAQHLVLSSGPLPWARLAIFSVASVAMLWTAVRVTQRQNF